MSRGRTDTGHWAGCTELRFSGCDGLHISLSLMVIVACWLFVSWLLWTPEVWFSLNILLPKLSVEIMPPLPAQVVFCSYGELRLQLSRLLSVYGLLEPATALKLLFLSFLFQPPFQLRDLESPDLSGDLSLLRS